MDGEVPVVNSLVERVEQGEMEIVEEDEDEHEQLVQLEQKISARLFSSISADTFTTS